VQVPKSGASTIANPARSVYAGVVTPARKSAGLKCIYAYPRLSPFSSGALTEQVPFSGWTVEPIDGIHISAGFARDAPSLLRTPNRSSARIPRRGCDTINYERVERNFFNGWEILRLLGHYDNRRSSAFHEAQWESTVTPKRGHCTGTRWVTVYCS